MKPRIKITSDVHQENVKAGELGHVDGYVRGGDNHPCAVVVMDTGHFVMVPLYQIEFLYWTDEK